MSGVVAELTLAFDRQKAQAAADQLAQDITAQMRATFDARMGALREQFQKGLIDRPALEKAGREAGRDFYEAVTAELQKREASGGLGTNGSGLALSLRKQFEEVNRAAVSTSSGILSVGAAVTDTGNKMTAVERGGIGRLRSGLTVLAQQAVGTNSAVGQLASGILQFAGGSLLVVGITAGIGIIVALYNEITKGARAAKAEVQSATQALLDMIDAENKSVAANTARAALRLHQLESGQAQPSFLDRAKAALIDYNAGLAPGTTLAAQRQREIGQLRAEIAAGDAAITVAFAESDERRRKAVERSEHELETALQKAAKQAAAALQHAYDEIKRAAQDALALNAPTDELFRQETRAFFTEMDDRAKALAEQAKKLDDMNKKLAEAESAGVDFPELPELLRQAADEAARLAQKMADTARAVVGLGQDLGLVNQQTAQVLNSATQIGESFLSGNVAGVVGGLGGLLSGVFGESADARALRLAMEDNAQAIRDLTQRITEINVTGSAQSQASAALDFFSGTPRGSAALRGTVYNGALPQITFIDELTSAAERAGLSFKDLTTIAKGFGINLDGSVDSIKRFREALTIRPGPITTYTGQVQALQNRIAVGLTPADQELVQTVAILIAQSPAFAQALRSIDLTTPEGRAQAKAAIQALYTRAENPKGTNGLSAQQLGGLTNQDVIDAAIKLTGLLGDTAAGGNTSSSFTYAGTITNASAMRIDAQLGTANAWLAQIARDTGILAGTGAQGGGVALTFLPGAISVGSDGSPVVNDSLIEIDRGLYLRSLDASASYGQAVLR